MENKKCDVEELARFFINQTPQKSYAKNIKMKNNKNFTTLRDSLYANESETSLSTKSISQVQETTKNHTKENSIEINKELIKFAEHRWKPKTAAFKVPQKFIQNSHRESDLTDFDETLPQMKSSFINHENSCVIESSFPYFVLIHIEKCYQDLLKDFKDNSLVNIAFKKKIAAIYMSLVLDENYPVSQIFISNANVNVFLIEELTIFLLLLFLADYGQEKLSENELINFKTCLSHSHLNFLFVILLIMENADVSLSDKENYEKCKVLLEQHSHQIDIKKYHLNFHSQNKIIKTVLNNLLSNLNEIDSNITGFILDVFNSTKTNTVNAILKDLRSNSKIQSKIKDIEHHNEDALLERDAIEEEEDYDDDRLPQPVVPFLPPRKPNDKRKYTIALDLDETLVHLFDDESEGNAYVKVRLGTEAFLTGLSKYFELVIFTASTKSYADIVIDGLDPNNFIEYRLYRQHTDVSNDINLKDLSKLGRDLSKTFIIDNIQDNYGLQPLNGLNISDFEGDEEDCELTYLLEDILEIEKNNVEDVREYLPIIRKKMLARYSTTN